jgi:hypothetical protein
MAQLITRQRPFPSFSYVRTDLRLAELNMASPSTSPSALVASSSTKPAAPAPSPSTSASRPPPSTTGGGSSGKDRGRGGRGQGGLSTGSAGGPHWPSLLNPWTGSIHMWPGSTSGGVRGPPRAGLPPPQAIMAGLPPARPLLPGGPRHLLPRALPGAAPSSDALGYTIPRQCFQHSRPQPASQSLRLGPRLWRLFSHRL